MCICRRDLRLGPRYKKELQGRVTREWLSEAKLGVKTKEWWCDLEFLVRIWQMAVGAQPPNWRLKPRVTWQASSSHALSLDRNRAADVGYRAFTYNLHSPPLTVCQLAFLVVSFYFIKKNYCLYLSAHFF